MISSSSILVSINASGSRLAISNQVLSYPDIAALWNIPKADLHFQFSPDGKYGVAVNYRAWLYDMGTGAELTQFGQEVFSVNPWPVSGQGIYRAAFSPNGKSVVLGVYTGSAIVGMVFSFPELQFQRYLSDPINIEKASVESVAISPDGRLAAISWNFGATVFEIESGEIVGRVLGDKVIKTVAFTPDGSQLWIAHGFHDTAAASVGLGFYDANGVQQRKFIQTHGIAGYSMGSFHTVANNSIIVLGEYFGGYHGIRHPDAFGFTVKLKDFYGLLEEWPNNYVANSPRGIPVTIDLFQPGGSVPIETRKIVLGNFYKAAVRFGAPPGVYDIRVRVDSWLAKRLDNIQVPGRTSAVTFELENGDCSLDNYVGTDDYLMINAAFDSLINSPDYDIRADLDRDGYVNSDDYLILNKNFDLSGD